MELWIEQLKEAERGLVVVATTGDVFLITDKTKAEEIRDGFARGPLSLTLPDD